MTRTPKPGVLSFSVTAQIPSLPNHAASWPAAFLRSSPHQNGCGGPSSQAYRAPCSSDGRSILREPWPAAPDGIAGLPKVLVTLRASLLFVEYRVVDSLALTIFSSLGGDP